MDIKQLFIFFIPYLLGAWGMITWRKRQAVPDIFFFICSWTLLSLSVYLGIIESQHGSFFWVVPVGFFALFFFSFQQAKAKLINGFLFNVFIAVFGAYLLFNFVLTQNIVIFLLLVAVALIFLFLALFGFIGLMILLYWNAVVVIKRESRSLANLLTLIAAILMTLWLIYDFTFAGKLPEWASTLLAILPMGLAYFGLVFLNFLTISILYQFNHPRYNQDFIIVLGAGLIDGERVTPLLAQRIDKAIRFYRQQQNKTTPPKFIMSGGQGPDEKIPEAVAMKNYALTQGIPEEDILVESNSTTTLENMKFSKEIVQQTVGEKAKVIFSSNNYHIFRAGIFARWAGLNADGIGSKTALYYLPNAFLREFIAIVAMNKRRHFLIVGILASLLLLLTLITWLVPLFMG